MGAASIVLNHFQNISKKEKWGQGLLVVERGSSGQHTLPMILSKDYLIPLAI